MTDNDLLEQLRVMRYPYTVDVVDQVMEQVRNKPLLVLRQKSKSIFHRIAVAVAAVAILAVGINVTLLFTKDYNEDQIGNMIASVYDYHTDYGSTADVYEDLGTMETLY